MQHAAAICVNEIAKLPKHSFVAIAGDSGSGKSYLVRIIIDLLRQKQISCELINHDEFLISRSDREPMKTRYYESGKFKGKSHWEILENMFRLDEYAKVISELRSGDKSTFHPYYRETGEVSDETRTVEPKDIILFDTSMMLDHMDFVILVDVTQDNIIARKIKRDSDIRTPEQITEMHQKVQGFYWTDRGVPEKPDIIVDNNDFGDVKVEVLSPIY
jgi:uridine kinase